MIKWIKKLVGDIKCLLNYHVPVNSGWIDYKGDKEIGFCDRCDGMFARTKENKTEQ